MDKYTSSFRVLNIMLFTLLLGFSFSASADKATWINAAGKVWVDGGGDCWMASTSGEDLCGAPAPAPAVAEESGFFWPDDDDADGVVNSQDACQFTPAGVSVDSKGCALDEDNDGVPDYIDACLGTPAGTVVNLDGCPMLLLKLTGILFASDKATLTSASKARIDQALPAIKSSSSTNMEVVGHTDSRASNDYNFELSVRRAQAVADYLVSAGVPSSRLSVIGKGESDPVADNSTSEGRAQNRRVEVIAR